MEETPDEAVEEQQELIEAAEAFESDDPHILALARASGARRFVTADMALIRDLTNPRLLSKPRGKVFSDRKKHKHLLINAPACDKCASK